MGYFALARRVPLTLSAALFALIAPSQSIEHSSMSTPAVIASSSASALSLTDSVPLPSMASSTVLDSKAHNYSFQDISVECNGRLYGRPLAASCLDAWRLMPPLEDEVTYADRSQEISSDVVLPWMFRT